ncbi:hypothetical protein [Chelativorans sp. Marseille-P2723]|uniref:hypothetical protein n=1 Tax=Chelativorans sp. Marseille-P2723 TaxID=2709133 RepID=UPI00156DAD0F|nr:hypothetical protein [Chelativorans sp. Marseille-P2723]
MQQQNKRDRGRQADALPPRISILLEEIEKEPVPERLLALARELQEALVERRGLERRCEAVEMQDLKVSQP